MILDDAFQGLRFAPPLAILLRAFGALIDIALLIAQVATKFNCYSRIRCQLFMKAPIN
jgi:hypothetical protein